MSDNQIPVDLNLPKFICVGAQRAGTTWLHECLKDHPEVYVPKVKEIHFFDRFYDKGLKSYAENFSNELIGSSKAWGEVTPNYYQEPNALERIKKDVPGVKLIYVIREPVSRAYSQYQLYSLTHYQGMSFESVIESKPTVTDLSMQGKYLEKMIGLFGEKDLLVLFYDEVDKDPESLIKKVYDFLGVDVSHVPSTINTRVNRVVLPELQAWLSKVKLDWLITLVKKSPFAELIKNAFHSKSHKKSSKKPSLSADTFSDDIRKIEEILGVDLSHWR